jgi:cardiolipin synthase
LAPDPLLFQSNKNKMLKLPAAAEKRRLEYRVLKLLPSFNEKNLSGYTTHNKIKLVRAGKEYFEILKEMVNNAKETIHLQTYILSDDKTGNEVTGALIAAAKRGVKVYVMADGYASQSLHESFIKKLKEAGIHFRFFEPVFKSKYFYFGRRLHHKLIVADAQYALVGGINISDRYNDIDGKPAWLDFALFAEGEICNNLCLLCWKTWEGFVSKIKTPFCETRAVGKTQEEECFIRMRRNDWVRNKNQISRSYLEMFRSAQSYITIVSSYFLPGRVFRRNIAYASERGVKIKVLLAGSSDVKLAKHAERYMYRWLLKNNIEIYEYKRNILHGKIAFYDDKWITAGSYNVNNISAYASIELNLDVHDELFTKTVKESINTIIENDCRRITSEYFLSHNHFLQRVWQKICSYIVRLIFYLFTFYFKQRH